MKKILAVDTLVIISGKNQIHDESQKLPQKITFPQKIYEEPRAKNFQKKTRLISKSESP
jgi:hypothetical protein